MIASTTVGAWVAVLALASLSVVSTVVGVGLATRVGAPLLVGA